MSAEEIIHAWKNPARALAGGEEAGNVPENPAGEQGLSDEELELVEGGGSIFACSCNAEDSCIHTAD
ncbi:MAG TPA: mersacidin/lichenicidin family type 2 lantibiotic [Ktedonobacteraceae bacterium]|nr:mersacidin/lichenicidin family type 2 lantibiotic [Ktedonobacteraceae bacterium]